MNEKIKTICLILITVSIVAGAIFYCYVIYDKHLMNKEKQQTEINFKKEQLKIEKEEKEEAEKEAVKNKLLLNICLAEADENYTNFWESECEGLDLGENCLLPTYNADRADKMKKQKRDECFKKYPLK